MQPARWQAPPETHHTLIGINPESEHKVMHFKGFETLKRAECAMEGYQASSGWSDWRWSVIDGQFKQGSK